MPVCRVGEKVPLVTSPIGTSPRRTFMCARGMPRSSATSPHSTRCGPAARSASRASRPQNRSLSHPTAQPARACSGVMSMLRSCPCSG